MYNNEDKYKLYDELISATYANIFSLSKGKDIVLKNFTYDCYTCKTFLEVSCMVAYMGGKEVYLESSFFDFIRARFKKKNKHIHWIRKNKKNKVEGIEPHQVSAFEAAAFGQDEDIFEKIFKNYYEGKEV